MRDGEEPETSNNGSCYFLGAAGAGEEQSRSPPTPCPTDIPHWLNQTSQEGEGAQVTVQESRIQGEERGASDT